MARSEAFFYHYTNGPAAREILKTHKLLASTDTKNDAKCGVGVYVTEKTPDHHTDEQLRFNNFGKGFPGKTAKDTQYYIKIPRSSLGKRKIVDGAKGARNRYLIAGGNLDLKNMDFSVGKRKDGRIIREVIVEKTAEVLSWLEDELQQGPTYSCLSCHQPIDPDQGAIRLRDRASGLHMKCWANRRLSRNGARCLLCQTRIVGFAWCFTDDVVIHPTCVSSAYDPECSTLTCKYCNSPAPMGLSVPVRLGCLSNSADCRRAECLNKANEQVNTHLEQVKKLEERQKKLPANLLQMNIHDDII